MGNGPPWEMDPLISDHGYVQGGPFPMQQAYHISSNRDVFIKIYYSSPGEIANWPTNIPK